MWLFMVFTFKQCSMAIAAFEVMSLFKNAKKCMILSLKFQSYLAKTKQNI